MPPVAPPPAACRRCRASRGLSLDSLWVGGRAAVALLEPDIPPCFPPGGTMSGLRASEDPGDVQQTLAAHLRPSTRE
jgi:hypothetical protein